MKLKLKKHWPTGEAVVQGFNTDFLRHTDKHNEFKIHLDNRFKALQDLLKGKNYYGAQLERDQRSTKLSVSGDAGPQQVSS
ncbi:unnamed protein product [Schistosoma margrebowiei]|uniref:Uncharacterized protein n=1 Tax=Schistosoma margrebowiei TaxID=48269 RepID=A0A183LXU6_9TREM|nr:unnamed protein product [Schistosoma margrebowiei]